LELLENRGTQSLIEDEPDVLKVKVSPFQRGLIEYIAERETTDAVTVLPEHVLMYVFDVMLVNGDKFSIKSIPDSVINRIKREVSND